MKAPFLVPGQLAYPVCRPQERGVARLLEFVETQSTKVDRKLQLVYAVVRKVYLLDLSKCIFRSHLASRR